MDQWDVYQTMRTHWETNTAVSLTLRSEQIRPENYIDGLAQNKQDYKELQLVSIDTLRPRQDGQHLID